MTFGGPDFQYMGSGIIGIQEEHCFRVVPATFQVTVQSGDIMVINIDIYLAEGGRAAEFIG